MKKNVNKQIIKKKKLSLHYNKQQYPIIFSLMYIVTHGFSVLCVLKLFHYKCYVSSYNLQHDFPFHFHVFFIKTCILICFICNTQNRTEQNRSRYIQLYKKLYKFTFIFISMSNLKMKKQRKNINIKKKNKSSVILNSRFNQRKYM